MVAVADENRVELLIEGPDFYDRVKIVCDNDELEWFDLKPFGLTGTFRADEAPALLKFCKSHADYHIVTYTSGDRYVNRYVPGQRVYHLAKGDRNPYLVYNPWIHPRRPLIDEDIFSKLGCEPGDIKRRRKI
jgi:hypothetical protein